MNVNLIRLCSNLHKENNLAKQEADNFIEEINALLIDEDILLKEKVSDSIIDVVFIESGGAESLFLKQFKKLSNPFVLISHCKNNSLPASLEIKTYCSNRNKYVYFLAGEEEQIAMALTHIISITRTYHSLIDNHLGVIGKPSDWLIASKVNYKDVKKIFKMNLINIPMEELFNLIDQDEMDLDIPHYEELNKKYQNKEVLRQALVIYCSLKKIIIKYNLQGLTIRCFDLLNKYHNTACLALSLLNEEGITCACEGDVPSLLTMHILTKLTSLPTFMANLSKVDFKNKQALFAHCTLPVNMTTKYELSTHFESNQGIGIKGYLPEGKITICKICPDLSLDHDICISANVKENLSLPGYCRTQILVNIDEGGLFSLMKEDYGNHLIITYGDAYQDFYPLLALFKKNFDDTL